MGGIAPALAASTNVRAMACAWLLDHSCFAELEGAGMAVESDFEPNGHGARVAALPDRHAEDAGLV